MVSPSQKPLDVAAARAWFPTLDTDFVFFENAGGSQVPAVVAEAIRNYMLSNYVQLDAPYDISRRSTDVVDAAHSWVNRIMGGEETGHVVLGPSSTQLAYMLAECYSRKLEPGDEIIINETGHEANVGPWVKLERFGIKIKWWSPINRRGETPIDDLTSLLTPRTKLVTFPHVSNLLGSILDVSEITRIVHEAGAKVVVDGVAYAPHRPIDVAAWEVDWYFYSTYKVYGPHMGALYGRTGAFGELVGPNHEFLPNTPPYKFELGGASHEGCAGLLGLKPYIAHLAGGGPEPTRGDVVQAFASMGQAELPLQKLIIEGLGDRGYEIIGSPETGDQRVGTISFVHPRFSNAQIVEAMVARGIGARNGHMYAYRLCKRLGIDTETGVVRVSLLHYNTEGEVTRLLNALSTLR